VSHIGSNIVPANPIYTLVMEKTRKIAVQSIPVLIMIGLIPLVQNDYLLTALYIGIILFSFLIKRRKYEGLIFAGGFLFMFVSELLFIQTGVETFNRHSLLGLMPLWLPFLWGYGFVVIRRSVDVLYRG
jgi:hypothetical protein